MDVHHQDVLRSGGTNVYMKSDSEKTLWRLKRLMRADCVQSFSVHCLYTLCLWVCLAHKGVSSCFNDFWNRDSEIFHTCCAILNISMPFMLLKTRLAYSFSVPLFLSLSSSFHFTLHVHLSFFLYLFIYLFSLSMLPPQESTYCPTWPASQHGSLHQRLPTLCACALRLWASQPPPSLSTW